MDVCLSGSKQSKKMDVCLSGSFESILFDQTTADVVIKSHDAQIYAHKVILTTRSPVFKAMLETPMEESKTNVIQIDDFSTKVIEELLRCFYTNKIPTPVLNSNGKDLMRISEKYQCLEIKDACAKYLSAQLTNKNAIEYLQLGEHLHSEILIDACIKFIGSNFFKVDRHDELVTLVEPQSAQALLTLQSRKLEMDNSDSLDVHHNPFIYNKPKKRLYHPAFDHQTDTQETSFTMF